MMESEAKSAIPGEAKPETPRRRRHWFSLGLRGLMILVLILGIPMAWKARRVSLQKRAVARIKQLHGDVMYDWAFDRYPFVYNQDKEPPAPRWMRRILGDEYFQEVSKVTVLSGISCISPARSALGRKAGL